MFDTVFLQDYYRLLDAHQLNETKRSFAFSYYGFVSIVFGFARKDDEFIKAFIFFRNKNKKELRERQFLFFRDIKNLAMKATSTVLSLKVNGITHNPVSFSILESIWNRNHDKILKEVNFFFNDFLPQLLIEEVKITYTYFIRKKR